MRRVCFDVDSDVAFFLLAVSLLFIVIPPQNSIAHYSRGTSVAEHENVFHRLATVATWERARNSDVALLHSSLRGGLSMSEFVASSGDLLFINTW